LNITEKILAKAAGLSKVEPDQIVDVAVDYAFTHEKLGPLFFDKFRELGLKIWDKDRAVIFADHGNPPSKVMDADLIVKTGKFAEDYGLTFYNGEGICHQIMPEKGYVTPGAVIVGTDSHTTTYGGLGAFSTGLGSTEMAWVFSKGKIWMKVPRSILFRVSGELGTGVSGKDLALHIMSLLGADGGNYYALEYTGSAVKKMDVDSRMTLCNMAVEAGAKNGIIEADEKVTEYLNGRTSRPYEFVKSDPGAAYEKTFDIDGGALQPTVALPGSSANSVPVTEALGAPFTRALLGTCTNGRMEDFRIAGKIMKGRKVHPTVRLQVIPGSRSIFRQCIEEGIAQIFLDAGAIWCNPNCGPCAGGHYGLLGKDEVCVSSSNRNMPGRMGDSAAKIYLASPATVTASAINGKITDPRDYL
jgi:homoaconitate hydratase family protein